MITKHSYWKSQQGFFPVIAILEKPKGRKNKLGVIYSPFWGFDLTSL